MQVVVAGTRLDLSGNCWSSRPRDIYCFGKGGMEWQHGERASLVAARDQEIGSMRGPNTHLEDGRELRLDIRTTTCGAAARGGECTTAAFFGVADQPALIRHFAIVQDKGRHILVKCTTTIDLKVPPPCRQFFGLPQTMTASLFR